MSGSIRFDRAAEFYDSSRAISPEAMERTVELLAGELRGRGRVLEVGVGTGLLALPLSEYLLQDIERTARRPTLEEVLAGIKSDGSVHPSEDSATAVRSIRDAE